MKPGELLERGVRHLPRVRGRSPSHQRSITGVTASYLQIGCFLAAAAGLGRARVSTGAERP